jgi:hypothetical protein
MFHEIFIALAGATLQLKEKSLTLIFRQLRRQPQFGIQCAIAR